MRFSQFPGGPFFRPAFKLEFTIYIPKKFASTNWKIALATLHPSRLLRMIQRCSRLHRSCIMSVNARPKVNVIFTVKTRKCWIKNLIKTKVHRENFSFGFDIYVQMKKFEQENAYVMGELGWFLCAKYSQNKFSISSDCICSAWIQYNHLLPFIRSFAFEEKIIESGSRNEVESVANSVHLFISCIPQTK